MAADGITHGVTEILKRLSIMVAREIGLAWGVKDEIQKLKKTLDMIVAVMVDAEDKQMKNEAVRKWLGELKDIAYEAEDILDERAYEDFHQRMTRKRDWYFFFDPIKLRFQTAHAIKDISEKLYEHRVQMETLGLKMLELVRNFSPKDLDESSRLRELRELRETYSGVDKSLRIMGRDKDKSKIINMLLHNDQSNQARNIQVIPIVGMGGVGKTTLAQLIRNENRVKNHFDLNLWVCVSDEFNVKKLFVKIIESITRKSYENVSNMDVIAGQLEEYLSGKKYLLVLDDVWNKNQEEWVRLRGPLLNGGSGSKILVTTRSKEVASIMGDEFDSYELGILDEDQSWSLFRERTFGYSGGAVETPTLTAIGKELVKKCGGLPLGLIFLISLLRNKDENEWRIINENKIWFTVYDETGFLPILKLSYDHLPSHLRQCFSYFSLFMKDVDFDRKSVILMWMAEGFLPQLLGGSNKWTEEIGNIYFEILLHNSFFQEVKLDEFGQVLSFKMHDLVHDLAIYVADDCQCFTLNTDESMENIPRVRRLRLVNINKMRAVVLHDNPKLRTLLINDESNKKIENNVFDGTKRLRVLKFSWSFESEEINWLHSISNLKHLRYLDLSFSTITHLPESVTRLFHLQTLDLRGCQNLKELPEGIGKLINLRHLYLPDDIICMPREMGQLNSLQTLQPINVANSYNESFGGIEILEGLNLLNGLITINHLRNVTSERDVQRADLKGKKNLKKIILNWEFDVKNYFARRKDDGGEYSEEEAVLEALRPHPNLKMLKISRYFGVKLPRWMGDPSCLPNLTNLELTHCTKCEQVVGFGKLPSLKVLDLSFMNGIKWLGNEFYDNNFGGVGYGSSSSSSGEAAVSILFPSLKELLLADLDLEGWVNYIPSSTTTVANCSCFPCLEEIFISHCPNLRITPTCFPSPRKLTLEEIDESVAVPLITTNLNSLEIVELESILNLDELPIRLLQGRNLQELRVEHCDDFKGFLPSEEEGFTSLKVLELYHLPNMEFLPDIRKFTSLEGLTIMDCQSLKPLPEDLTWLPSSLEHLKSVHILNVKDVEDFKYLF